MRSQGDYRSCAAAVFWPIVKLLVVTALVDARTDHSEPSKPTGVTGSEAESIAQFLKPSVQIADFKTGAVSLRRRALTLTHQQRSVSKPGAIDHTTTSGLGCDLAFPSDLSGTREFPIVSSFDCDGEFGPLTASTFEQTLKRAKRCEEAPHITQSLLVSPPVVYPTPPHRISRIPVAAMEMKHRHEYNAWRPGQSGSAIFVLAPTSQLIAVRFAVPDTQRFIISSRYNYSSIIIKLHSIHLAMMLKRESYEPELAQCCLDLNSTVRIPEADGAIPPAAQAILAVAIEPHSQNRSLVSSQDVRLPLRQLRRAHPLLHRECAMLLAYRTTK
nr:hypothetical protein VITISV_039725 [Ipomoea batatas]